MIHLPQQSFIDRVLSRLMDVIILLFAAAVTGCVFYLALSLIL